MNPGIIFSIIFISHGAIAIVLALLSNGTEYRTYRDNRIFGYLCIASAIWSYGFAIVYITQDTSVAYWGRVIGMAGVFGFFAFSQNLIIAMSEMPKRASKFFGVFAILGMALYVFQINPNLTSFWIDKSGMMSYTFQNGIVNNLYTVYCVLFAVNMAYSLVYYQQHSTTKRARLFSKGLISALILVFIGMILDTVFPMLGYPVIPGSTYFQFIGVFAIYITMYTYNRSRVNVNNMSEHLFASVTEPVLVFEPDGRLAIVNEGAKRLFAELSDFNSSDNLCVGDIFPFDDDFLQVIDEHRSDDTHSLKSDIPVHVQTTRVIDGFGDTIAFLMTANDMTQINEMMDSLKLAKEHADENSRAKSIFLANMSHEIRTPLNVIISFSELLLKGSLNADQREQAEDIRNSSNNLLAIINDVLDISKIESGKMEIVEGEYSITSTLREVCMITETLAAKKNLEFTMDIDSRIPSLLYGDSVRIRAVLVNLLNNAVKYTQKGFVKFSAELLSVSDKKAMLRFTVSDSGIGIKIDDESKLFDAFSQFDRQKNSGIEGTGLGLAIVKGFLNLMGGSISVESEYGKGTSFIVEVAQKVINENPIGNIDIKHDVSKSESNIGDVKFSGVKLLAVDDNKVNLKVIKRCLATYDMDITTADSGQEAIELCRNNQFDLIFMDQMMPVMDGVEAMHHIRELDSYYAEGGGCVIIALTANAIAGVREQLIGEGFDNYLSKPIYFPELEAMLKDFVDKGRI